MVSTLDFESSDPSSNLGRTYLFSSVIIVTPWRNGSASDSRSEGCVFKSRRGQQINFEHKLADGLSQTTALVSEINILAGLLSCIKKFALPKGLSVEL